jgi:hypothetical protein
MIFFYFLFALAILSACRIREKCDLSEPFFWHTLISESGQPERFEVKTLTGSDPMVGSRKVELVS